MADPLVIGEMALRKSTGRRGLAIEEVITLKQRIEASFYSSKMFKEYMMRISGKLFAVGLLWLSAMPAQAGFSVGFSDSLSGAGFGYHGGVLTNNNDDSVFKLVSHTATTFQVTGTIYTNTADTTGYSVSYTGSINSSPNQKALDGDISIRGLAGSAPDRFNTFLSTSGLTGPAGTTHYLAGAYFSGPSAANFTPGWKVFAGDAEYTVPPSGKFLNAHVVGILDGPGETRRSPFVPIPGFGSPYQLTTLATVLESTGGVGHVVFRTEGAVVSKLPEPTSVVMGLAGIPCMLGLVGLIRRRTTKTLSPAV